MTHYELKWGSYYLVEERTGSVVLMTDQVAIAFDASTNTMLKHGSPDAVMKWYQENGRKAPGLFDDVRVMVLPRGVPVEEINPVLTTSGYVETLLRRIDEGTLRLLPVDGPRHV